jgi:putative FmdB family regulatory protein
MPTYEYACKKCGEHLEVVQSFTDPPKKRCPKCRGQLRKVFSPVGISFKGSGFYKTDSRPKSKESTGSGTKADSSSSKPDSSATKSDSSKSESSKSESSGSKSDAGGSSPSPSKPSKPSTAAAS